MAFHMLWGDRWGEEKQVSSRRPWPWDLESTFRHPGLITVAKKNSFNPWLVKEKICLTIVKELEAILTEFHSLGESPVRWERRYPFTPTGCYCEWALTLCKAQRSNVCWCCSWPKSGHPGISEFSSMYKVILALYLSPHKGLHLIS